ncbi:ATP-dependent RNA helicase rok1 [Tricharina praecox]|uniref:ATP-dependent RNA helicase rok1 n=1 Tax=Tricharina praecox TaxID=43433 RepID=UPI00221F99F1|nr:ATP-dependent RNA helicase rok1 [Tricharina praecox]KAI5842006.1 ATP-dependent RNA helicase rok1 [Tricharina praecox]
MTDVFRLLTRSATFSRPAQSKPAASKSVPSNPVPSKPTPVVLSAKGAKKRKIAVDADVAVPDFFGQGQKRGAEATASAGKRVKRDGSDDEAAESDAKEVWRRLRANKLKFTVLSASTDEPKEDENAGDKKKKKKSKAKEEEEEKAQAKKKAKKTGILIPPMMAFPELRNYNLSRRVYANVLAQGYASPTEVQMGALPVLMKSDLEVEGVSKGTPVDLLVCAPTGSGKTLAYVLPLVNRLLRARKEDGGKKGIKAVILAPTKELVGQIANEVKKLIEGTGIKVSQFKKGHRPVSAEDTVPEDDKTPCVKSDIVVSTPLVLKHAIESAGESSMTGLMGLVLDEADVLLDELFLEQTMSIWKTIRDRSKNGCLRTSLWSATMPSTTENLMTKTLLESPTNPPAVLRLVVGIKDTSLPSISQSIVYAATEAGKLLALRNLFTTSLRPPLLIFMQSIPRAQALYNEIQYDLPTPGRIAVLHSELTDTVRSETMTRFRLGEIWILITTDILSRGMDFRGVKLVINYDLPTSVASYIHRVGRTGRAGSEGGSAITYCTKEDIPYIKGIANVIRASAKGSGGGEGGVQKWLLDSLPKTSKNDKKKLKLHGVEVRQGKDAKHRISTKSGFQRKMEDRKRGALEGSRRRKLAEASESEDEGDGGAPLGNEGGKEVGEFTGFD